MRKTELTEEKEKQIVNNYKNNVPLRVICKLFHVHHTRLRSILDEHGIETRKIGGWYSADIL